MSSGSPTACSGSPSPRWRARCAKCRCIAGSTRAISVCSASAEPGRCMSSWFAEEAGDPARPDSPLSRPPVGAGTASRGSAARLRGGVGRAADGAGHCRLQARSGGDSKRGRRPAGGRRVRVRPAGARFQRGHALCRPVLYARGTLRPGNRGAGRAQDRVRCEPRPDLRPRRHRLGRGNRQHPAGLAGFGGPARARLRPGARGRSAARTAPGLVRRRLGRLFGLRPRRDAGRLRPGGAGDRRGGGRDLGNPAALAGRGPPIRIAGLPVAGRMGEPGIMRRWRGNPAKSRM